MSLTVVSEISTAFVLYENQDCGREAQVSRCNLWLFLEVKIKRRCENVEAKYAQIC